MIIPGLFSTSANGCPSGTNGYTLWHASINNLNTGTRGRVYVNWNTYTEDIVGPNFQGIGGYSGQQINIGNGIGAILLNKPSATNITYPVYGTAGQNISLDYQITGSNDLPITYCYDCTQKYRWTFGSYAGLAAPWPSVASPLTIAILSSPSGSINNNASYTTKNFTYSVASNITEDTKISIKIKDTTGHSSISVDNYLSSIVSPNIHNISHVINNGNALISWDYDIGSYKLYQYKITSGTDVYTTTDTNITVPLNWLGQRSIKIESIDE
mgnify:CR=1 FL=1